MKEYNEKIDIKKNNEKKINLINKEIEYVNKLITKIEEKINTENKNVFLTYDDIINGDKDHNYIAVKSKEGTSPDIMVINEDDLENINLDINNLKKSFFSNSNMNINLKNDITHNNYLNQFLYKKNQEDQEIFNNNNDKNINEKPIDLFFISPNEQEPIENNINNDLCSFNNEDNNNNIEFVYNK